MTDNTKIFSIDNSGQIRNLREHIASLSDDDRREFLSNLFRRCVCCQRFLKTTFTGKRYICPSCHDSFAFLEDETQMSEDRIARTKSDTQIAFLAYKLSVDRLVYASVAFALSASILLIFTAWYFK